MPQSRRSDSAGEGGALKGRYAGGVPKNTIYKNNDVVRLRPGWKRHGLETANILWQNAEAAPSRRFSNIAFPTYGKEHFAFLAMLRGEAEN